MYFKTLHFFKFIAKTKEMKGFFRYIFSDFLVGTKFASIYIIEPKKM